MADEQKKAYAADIEHIQNGSAVSAGAFSATSDIDVAISSSNHYDYPFADLIFTAYWTGTPTAGEQLRFYRRDINVVGSNSEPAPSVNRKQKLVGVIVIDPNEPTYYQLKEIELTKECEFYVENATSASLQNNAWDLTIRPWTYVPT